MVWRVGRDDDISFWYDNWIKPQSLVELVSLDDDVHLDPNVKVNEFIQNAQCVIHKLNQTLNYHPIIHKIIEITLPVIDMSDSFCWSLNSSGSFTTEN